MEVLFSKETDIKLDPLIFFNAFSHIKQELITNYRQVKNYKLQRCIAQRQSPLLIKFVHTISFEAFLFHT